jgi:hypothetical protein
MADNQTDQAPSVLSVKSYYTAGTGISITGGQISATSSGASRAIYSTETSFPLTISAPASSVIKRKYYLNNGASAATVNLPAVAGCDGLEIVLKKLGSGTVTVDASGSETIDGSLTLTLSQQYASVTLTATSSGWYIE